MAAPVRKLTTVLAADVQGYSRLMEHDEEGTLATLKLYRDSMARLVGAHGGRIVNTWGDAVIAEFPSVVEAVRAAIEVQNDLAERNAGRQPDQRMVFRIGINLGDVIVEGDDIYGDGVNIAARLQSEAEPGGILISSTVFDQVRNKIAVSFDFRGDLVAKNIDEPVPSYAVRIGDAAHPAPVPASRPEPAEPSDFPAWGRDAPPASPTRMPAPAAPDRLPGRVLLALPPEIRGLVGAAAVVTIINVFTWSGTFWAKWPLLGIAIVIGGRLLFGTGRRRRG
ncbi:adenylate/guanylate cyclase domain-containing protein [Aquibium sp. ELW1220]|uniref:adenylate/guanylate cyclase domain-containing protein n=1 Tax=Aquibium sp. ELW1220 TaxID=2976766 RepID=UPI0025B251AD|nr:adenylate/guanylate cyclase domain-containing protein [Aquibium sp. ELW1220]MDN2582696.1 adenylate/guanylate cyclase domain-containing protein [Aquibium sp. ELW1220]